MATCRRRPFGSGQMSRVESVLEDAPKFVNFKENYIPGIKEILSSTVLSTGINWSANRTLSKTLKDSEREDRFGGSWKCCILLTVGLLVAIVFTVVVAVLSSQTTHQNMRSKGANDQKSSVYQNAAVVTDTEICSTMGKDILERGGSAVDAAITSQLCIGLVNGQSSGLGGGFFMGIYDAANAKFHFIDARETGPAGANEAYLATKLGCINSTAVPGEVRGLWDAHQKYGKLPWEDLFTPVIDLAEKGYRASAHLEDTLRKMELVKPLSDYDGAWDIYLREDGSRKREGDLVINIALANTLRAISVNGSDEFYTGATAQKLIDEVEELGGILTLRDLSSYSTRSGNALTSPIRDGMMLLAPPSPSGGAVLQFIVNVMSSFNLTREDFQPGPNLVRTYHRFLEASRFGFGLRSRTGDEETPGVQQALDALASIDYAREIAASIPTNRVYSTNSSYYNVMPQITTTLGGTSHVNVLAANGDAVSSTTSVNYRFGSKIRSASTGIIYNNEMSDFSYDSASPNYARPGKRPLSAMCGSIVIDRDGRVQLVEGSAGSKKIITVNAWALDALHLLTTPVEIGIIPTKAGVLTHSKFGSKIRSGSTGIIYNNEMSDFSYDSASPNYARPGKRPLSAMCGSIVIDREGRVQLVEGSAGSKKIITVNAWVILSTMLGEVPLSQAVDGKLIHAELRPDIVEIYESGFDQDMIDQLTTLGHDLTEQKTIFAVIQAIMRSDDEIHAYSDPRKGGKPAGY
eukprot:XP_011670939.1 PREDICTED: gamma-glutamyltranspeptidase 1 [Strongylocentrotus purpuratus]